MMSAGGATEIPYDKVNGSDYGTQVGNFAKQFNFDGV